MAVYSDTDTIRVSIFVTVPSGDLNSCRAQVLSDRVQLPPRVCGGHVMRESAGESR